MSKLTCLGLTLIAILLCAAGCKTTCNGGRPLPLAFNGKDLSGWRVPAPNLFWRVENGVLVGQNDASLKGNVLYTEREYKDFVLEADARWNGEIDSGFIFRRPELQLQIGVSRSLKRDFTGSFYTGGKEKYPESGQAKEAGKLIKPGEWNHFRLEVRGDTYTMWINGVKASQYTDSKYKDAGPVGLQIHPGLAMKIEFKNIRIGE